MLSPQRAFLTPEPSSMLQSRSPKPSCVPSWSIKSPSSSAFWRTLESQPRCTLMVPYYLIHPESPLPQAFSTSAGTLPDMSWLLPPSVLSHPGQYHGFSSSMVRCSGCQQFGIERQEIKTPYTCRPGSRGPSLSSCSSFCFRLQSIFFPIPGDQGIWHVMGSFSGELCQCLCSHRNPHHGHHVFWKYRRWIMKPTPSLINFLSLGISSGFLSLHHLVCLHSRALGIALQVQ